MPSSIKKLWYLSFLHVCLSSASLLISWYLFCVCWTRSWNYRLQWSCVCIISANYWPTSYNHQICIADASNIDASTDRFTPGLTYFSRSHRSKCKNQIFRQLRWHKSYLLHTSTYNLELTDIGLCVQDYHHTPKTMSVQPTLWVKFDHGKRWVWIGIFKPAEPQSPWDACLCSRCMLCYFVFSCQLPGKTRLLNDLLCVKWDVKSYTLIHSHFTSLLLLLFSSHLFPSWIPCTCLVILSIIFCNFFLHQSWTLYHQHSVSYWHFIH